MATLKSRITEAAEAVRARTRVKPQVAIILGTGLGRIAADVAGQTVVAFADVPGFPTSNLEGHAGRFVIGTYAGKPTIVMDGRFHIYEGFSLDEVTLPIRVMRELGASVLVVSNAAGGLNPMHEVGDIVIIDDHIGLFGPNALVGENDDSLGPRFPDMSAPYDRDLIERAEAIAIARGVRAHRGVYVWVTGPSLETRAEYRMLRMLGSDVVGMSTVPEVMVAVHGGMRVCGFSVITDRCLPDALVPGRIEEIIATANKSGAKLAGIIKDLVAQL
jgi:purine-nucleoside phosphorylase